MTVMSIMWQQAVFFIPINFDIGELKGKGFTAMKTGSEMFTEHPTTKFHLPGYKIPFFKESIELCKKFASYIPNRIIGWDVAITPNGPIIIEGNLQRRNYSRRA